MCYMAMYNMVANENNRIKIIWWQMKIIESRYGYYEATVGFSIVLLGIVLSGCSIGAHLEVHFPFSTRDLSIL